MRKNIEEPTLCFQIIFIFLIDFWYVVEGFHLFPFINNDSQNYQGTKHTSYWIPKGICLKIGSHQLFLYFQKLIPLLLNPMEIMIEHRPIWSISCKCWSNNIGPVGLGFKYIFRWFGFFSPYHGWILLLWLSACIRRHGGGVGVMQSSGPENIIVLVGLVFTLCTSTYILQIYIYEEFKI